MNLVLLAFVMFDVFIFIALIKFNYSLERELNYIKTCIHKNETAIETLRNYQRNTRRED